MTRRLKRDLSAGTPNKDAELALQCRSVLTLPVCTLKSIDSKGATRTGRATNYQARALERPTASYHQSTRSSSNAEGWPKTHPRTSQHVLECQRSLQSKGLSSLIPSLVDRHSDITCIRFPVFDFDPFISYIFLIPPFHGALSRGVARVGRDAVPAAGRHAGLGRPGAPPGGY